MGVDNRATRLRQDHPGTLVMHCDSVDFLVGGREKYWEDLLEIFAKRIAAQAFLASHFLK
jgi:hypothetical protein